MEYTFYKLSIGDKCYVGSTENFNNRMSQHKCRCYSEKDKKYNCKVYQYMRQNGGFEKVDIMIIDKIIYNNKEQSLDMETKYMLMFNAELNSVYPKRSKKERYETNKESILEKRHKFYQENKERLSLKDKEKYEKNKESVKERVKKYREENREKISEKLKEKVACDICSKMMSKGYVSAHKKLQH
tara:strand:- start:27 stop:581 length:555 start_codon:yes stop_codon:yes gene_type:complete